MKIKEGVRYGKKAWEVQQKSQQIEKEKSNSNPCQNQGLSSETKSDTAEVQPSVSVVGNPIHTSMTEQPEAKNTSKSSTDGKKMYIRATIYIISLFFILIVVLFQPGLLSTYESILEKLFSLAILCMKS